MSPRPDPQEVNASSRRQAPESPPRSEFGEAVGRGLVFGGAALALVLVATSPPDRSVQPAVQPVPIRQAPQSASPGGAGPKKAPLPVVTSINPAKSGVATVRNVSAGQHLEQPQQTPPARTPSRSASDDHVPGSVMPRPVSVQPRRADLGDEPVTAEVRVLAHWVAHSADNADADFMIVDKKGAALHVFAANARLRASTPVLLGSARGDHTVPGIGDRPLSQVRPEERTTPAGRFVAEWGRNTRGEDVIWVDYDAAVSMHRVLTTNPRERRLARLESPSIRDNRISYGCINVPTFFYEAYLRPMVSKRRVIVYVLPEVRPLHQVFGSYDVGATTHYSQVSHPRVDVPGPQSKRRS